MSDTTSSQVMYKGAFVGAAASAAGGWLAMTPGASVAISLEAATAESSVTAVALGGLGFGMAIATVPVLVTGAVMYYAFDINAAGQIPQIMAPVSTPIGLAISSVSPAVSPADAPLQATDLIDPPVELGIGMVSGNGQAISALIGFMPSVESWTQAVDNFSTSISNFAVGISNQVAGSLLEKLSDTDDYEYAGIGGTNIFGSEGYYPDYQSTLGAGGYTGPGVGEINASGDDQQDNSGENQDTSNAPSSSTDSSQDNDPNQNSGTTPGTGWDSGTGAGTGSGGDPGTGTGTGQESGSGGNAGSGGDEPVEN